MSEQSDTPRTDAFLVEHPTGFGMGFFTRDLERELAAVTRERDEARAELEVERMRLAACGVIALANTPESAAKARDMLPQYRSASSDDVARAVDREMQLRAEVERLRSALRVAIREADGWYDDARGGPCPGIAADIRELAATEPKP